MTSTAAPGLPGARSGSIAAERTGMLSGTARVAEDFVAAERHSRRVRALKFALPSLGVLIAVGFAAFSYLATPPSVSVDVAGSAIRDGKLVMANPKLDGFTEENLPYSMTAARAIQNLQQTGVIALEQIDAKLPVDADNFAMITAPAGTYDREKNTLDITSEMTVTTTDGMVVRFESAFLDMGKGMLTTSEPVDIRLDGSRIAADSMTVTEGGKVLVFEKRVRVQIDSNKLTTAQTEAGDADASN
jgi:lipopolysaccharide export system protein LptC